MMSWLRGLGRKTGTGVITPPSAIQGIRQALGDLQSGKLHESVLFPQLAAGKRSWFITSHVNGSGPAMFATVEGRPFGVMFSDRELAAGFLAGSDLVPQERDGFALLQVFLRTQVQGILINPATEKVVLDHEGLRLLFREYALVQGAELNGAWVPVQDDSLLVVELGDPSYTVPFFLSEEDAQAVSQQHGGTATFVSWQRIRDRCHEVKADAAYLGYTFPEGLGVTRRQLNQLAGDGRLDPLDRLEDEIRQSMGIANAAAIIRAMADLEYIWTLVDKDGDVVQFGDSAQFFTSCKKAQDFVVGMKAKGMAFARAFPAGALFRASARSPRSIRLNPGSRESWVGFADTLPLVVDMLAG